LTVEKSLRLKSAKAPILPLGHIEDDGVSVELGSGVTVYRPRGVMLELRGDELACCLSRVVAAHAGLRVSLQLIQGCVDGLTVRLSHMVVAADKRGQ
jgi:hypothetical protein